MSASPIPPAAERDYERQLREMNEALLISSVRQHELTEEAIQARQAVETLNAQLAESEERARTLVQQVKDYAIFRTDLAGRPTSWNEGVKRILGFDEADFIGQDITAAIFTPEDVQDGVPEQDLRTAATEGSSIHERWMQRKDGTRFPASGVTTALKNVAGTIIGFSKVLRDITERKASERVLAEHARLLDLSNDAIIVRDVQNRITYWNHGAEALFGWTREEVLGQDLQTLLKTEFESPFDQLFAQLRRESRLTGEVVQTARDGRHITLLCRWALDRDAEDNAGAILTTATDITERARLERQMQEQAEALADLHKRKDEFLAMLSHELRNPLSPILNAAHILRLQKDANPMQQQARAIIERQVGQLSHLVNDLLEVSRVITGRIQLHLERLDVRGIVEQAMESVRPLIDQRRHKLFVALPAEPIWLQGDSARLEQVLVNLLNNAAKYTNEGGQIWLSVEPEGAELVLRVRDSGVGIAPELLPRIFDLFTQAERSLDRSQGGLGIGLSLVQRLVELHHGTVAAESAGLGQGSEFIVRLPAILSPEVQAKIAPTETALPAAQAWRVLVVDDHVDGAEMVAAMMQMYGHQTRTAYSGQSALEMAVEYQPDFVVLDIGLPEMDGYEVARRLRRLPELKDTRLIAATGYGRDSDRQRSKEAGFDYHLVKPVEPEALQKLLMMRTTQERSEEWVVG